MRFILLFVINIVPVFTLKNQMHIYNSVNIRKPETVRILISRNNNNNDNNNNQNRVYPLLN
jgi:hypothetical protein